MKKLLTITTVLVLVISASCRGAQYNISELPEGTKATFINTVKVHQHDSLIYQRTDSIIFHGVKK